MQSAASMTQMQHNHAQMELQRVQQYYSQQMLQQQMQQQQQQQMQQRIQAQAQEREEEVERDTWMMKLLQGYFTKEYIY